jgi:hypothetical protein
MAEGIVRAASDSLRRCQRNTSKGQCPLEALEGHSYCIAHGGGIALAVEKREKIRNYRLTKFQDQIERHADSDNIKGLREEIGILRFMLEERLNQCVDNIDLMVQASSISDLVLKIDKLVCSCHKLEGSMGNLLDKQALITFSGVIIRIIGESLTGQESKINEIADKILSELGNLSGIKEEE